MDDEIEISIEDETAGEADAIQLPVNFLTIGEVANDDVKVYIRQSVYKALEEYAVADTAHERGTIILGSYSNALNGTHVIISEYIEAKYTDASASTLTFTHETWDYVSKVHEEKYPDLKIIGWQHTHPGYGIFLSNYDMFIQENFFNLPFQVAYVIDPVQKLRGFFQWKNGRVEKLKGFYIYDDIGKTIRIDEPKKKKQPAGKSQPEQAPEKSGSIKLDKLFNGLAILFAAVLLVAVAILLKNFNSLRDQVASQEQEISALDETIAALNSGSDADDKEETTAVSSSGTDTAAGKTDDMAEFVKYEIKNGDTLESICTSLGVDYYSCRNIILGINGIADENHITVGQTILIPVTECAE